MRTVVSATRSRNATDERKRRGRDTGNWAIDVIVRRRPPLVNLERRWRRRRRCRRRSGVAATAATTQAPRLGDLGGAAADRDDRGGDVGEVTRCGLQRVPPRLDRRAAGQHHGVGRAEQPELTVVGRYGDRGVRLDGDDVMAGGAQPAGEAIAGAVGLRQQHSARLRRECGQQRVAVRLRRNEVDRPVGARREGGRRRRADGGEADVGMCSRRRADARAAPFADVTTSQSKLPSAASAASTATPPSDGGPIVISGTWTTTAPQSANRSPSVPSAGRVTTTVRPASRVHAATASLARRAIAAATSAAASASSGTAIVSRNAVEPASAAPAR